MPGAERLQTDRGQQMSQKLNDGGPAFPGPAQHEVSRGLHEGMSLRDWFAGQALAGMLADPNVSARGDMVHVLATDLYRVADAMLKARVQ